MENSKIYQSTFEPRRNVGKREGTSNATKIPTPERITQKARKTVKPLDGLTYMEMTAVLIRVDQMVKNGNILATKLSKQVRINFL
jgi:hypothetical protein